MNKFSRIVFFICCAHPSLQATLTWTKNIYGVAIGTESTTTYTYDMSVPFNKTSLTGSLVKTDTEQPIEWYYDAHIKPANAPGSWVWRNGITGWIYDYQSQSWSAIDNDTTWNKTTSWITPHSTDHLPAWENRATIDTWALSPAVTDWGVVPENSTWLHHIGKPYSAAPGSSWRISANNNTQYQTFDEAWHNIVDNDWVCITFSGNAYRWQLDQETAQWRRMNVDGENITPSSEVWQSNQDGSLSRIVDDEPVSTWTHINLNYWHEEETNTDWQYTASGEWTNLLTEETWIYNEASVTSGLWHNNTTNQYTYFPPIVPPLVIIQNKEINRVLLAAQETASGPINNNPGNQKPFELDSSLSVALEGTDFIVNNTSGRGTTFGFNSSAAFDSDSGEQWTQIALNPGAGATYQNTSAGIILADTVIHHTGTDCWWRQETNSSHTWQYFIENDTWYNRSTTARYSFNATTKRWAQVAGIDEWEYIAYAPYGWAWHNTHTNAHWIYRANPNNGSESCWWHEETDTYWQPSGTAVTLQQTDPVTEWVYNPATGLFESHTLVDGYWSLPLNQNTATLYNLNTSTTWHYNNSTHLWHTEADPDLLNGAELFPLLPPTPAGIASALSKTALTETESISTAMPEIAGTINRFQELTTRFVTAKTTFNRIKATLSGSNLYNALIPLITEFSEISRIYTQLEQEYSTLYSAYAEDRTITPTTEFRLFDSWAPTRFRFTTPGLGIFKFMISDISKRVDIGFSSTPTTDGTAPLILSTDSLQFTQGDTLISSFTSFVNTETMPPLVNNTPLWCVFNNGQIDLYAHEQKLKYHRINWSAPPDASTIQYFCFATTFAVSIQIIPYPSQAYLLVTEADTYKNKAYDLLAETLSANAINSTAATWSKDYLDSVSGSNGSIDYRYDLSQVFDSQNILGSLTKTDLNNNLTWAYDAYQLPEILPGSWRWLHNNTEWKYEYQTRSWCSTGDDTIQWNTNPTMWSITDSETQEETFLCSWENRKKIDSWSQAIIHTDFGLVPPNSTWIHHVGMPYTPFSGAPSHASADGGINYQTFDETWQNIDNDWVCLNFFNHGYRWHFDAASSEWRRIRFNAIEVVTYPAGGKGPITVQVSDGSYLPSNEVWHIDPLLETLTYTGINAQPNRWRNTSLNYWQEEESGVIWQYRESGLWQNLSTNDFWAYNPVAQESEGSWKKVDSNESTHLPPLLPPRALLQFHEIRQTYLEAATVATGPITENPDDIKPFESSNNSLKMVDNEFIMAGAGRGTTFNFDADFTTENGEVWHYITKTPGNGALYQNTSANQQLSENVIHHAATDRWWRNETNSSHKWHYDVAQNHWINSGTNAHYIYDLPTNTWHHFDSTENDTWHYQNDSEIGWHWHHAESNQDWVYRTHPNNSSGNCWLNINTSEYWQPAGTSNNPLLRNITTDTLWSYNSTTHQWHSPENPTTLGEPLFPLLPPTIAGYAGAMASIALHETDSVSTAMPDISGGLARLQSLQERFTNAIAEYAEILATTTGSTAYAHTQEYLKEFSVINKEFSTVNQQFESLYRPYHEDGILVPSSTNTFADWAPTSNYFYTPGRGFFSGVINTLPSSFSIGFSDQPTSDGTAPYSIVFTLTDNKTSSYSIQVKEGNTILHQIDDWRSIYLNNVSFWCVYNNGTISLRYHTIDNEILHYTITTPSAPATMLYYTFASSGLPTVTAHTYPPYTAELTLDSADYINYLKDQINLTLADECWIESKVKFNALVASTEGYELKRRTAEKIQAFMGGSGLNFSPISIPVTAHLQGGLLSSKSNDVIDYLYSSMYGTKAATALLTNYIVNLQALEATLNALLTADPVTLSVEEQQLLINNTITASNNLIDGFIGNAFGAISELSNLAWPWPQNEDLLEYKNFIDEERALLTQLTATFQIMTPLIIERFKQQTTLFAEDNTTTQALIAQQEATREASKATILRLLATEVARGNATMFVASLAAGITFCLNSKFDTIRQVIDQYLNDNGYTSAHTFGEPNSTPSSNSVDNIYNTLQAILSDTEAIININGSVSFPQFNGNSAQPTMAASTTYLHETFNAQETQNSIASEAQSIPAGTSDYLKNTLASTAPTETTRTMLREFNVPDRIKTEAYSRVYIKDALVALGNGNYSAASSNALSVLGAAEITPDGNAMITLNSDLTIAGNNFLRPSASFGNDTENATRCIPSVPRALRGKHEIIFHSEVERTITIASGTDLDLTGFAQGLVTNGQRIVFSGKVRLIFEPNTRLRLPYTQPNESANYGLVIAFKDDAQLIFQGTENYDTAPWQTAEEGADLIRCKILGVGTLQFNDTAQARIMRSAKVSVEADYTSNVTAITIELNNKSGWYVGDTNITGGSFQVGNITNNGSNNLDMTDHYPNTINHPRFGNIDNPFLPRPTLIDFTLSLNSADATFMIGRNGFVGLGVGTVNKNGPINNWDAHGLYNTGNITLNLFNGTFWHHIIANGTSADASLLAFGPLTPRSNYQLNLNKNKTTVIMSGGNVAFFRNQNSLPYDVVADDPLASENVSIHSAPQPLSINTSILPLVGDATDNGKHSILAPIPVITARQKKDSARPGYKRYGRAAIQDTPTTYRFTGPLDEFYLAMTMQKLSYNSKYVIAALNNKVPTYTLIDGSGTISSAPIVARTVRTAKAKAIKNNTTTNAGFLRTTATTARPKAFIKPDTN